MRLYVLTAWTAYEGEEVFGVTNVESVANEWLAGTPPKGTDGCRVLIYDVAADGKSEFVEGCDGSHL